MIFCLAVATGLMRMRSTACALVVLAGALAGCEKRGPEAEATIAKYRPSVEARLAAVRQIGEQLKGMPALSSDGAALDSGPAKLWTGLDSPLSTDNAIMEEGSRLARDLSVDPGYGVGTKELWWCARILGDKHTAERISASSAEAHLAHCANAKYLLVVRVLESTYPRLEEGKTTFQPGSMTGEVRVFNLGTGKDLGGFRFKARNSDVVISKEGRARDYTAVSSDLTSQANKEVRAGIAKYLGGS